MNKKVYISLACVLAINANAVDLGTINIESSTIDDKFEKKKTEVSNIMVIKSEDIERINPTNVEDVLKTIPGITASNVGNDRVKIHIRGVDNHRYMGEKPGVAVVIDGVPVQETTGKINLDLDNIESIKVIKGGASYLYGNDALAGAVVITTKRAKGVSASKIESEIGSFGFKRVLASTNQALENGSLQLQGTVRDSDGYWDDAYLKHKSVNGKYQHYIGDTSDITFGLDYTKRETGDGTSVSGETAAKINPKSVDYVSYAGYYDTTLLKSFLTYSNDIDDNSNIMFNISRYEDETTNRATPDITDTDHTKISDEKWIQNTLKSEYRKSFDSFAIMTGIDIARNSQDTKDTATGATPSYGATPAAGTILSDANTDEDINAIYVELQNQLSNNLKTTINIRHDQIKYDYKDNLDSTLNVDPKYNETSYRIGANYTLSDTHNIYSSFATGFRAPSASQISENQEGIALGLDVPKDLEAETTYNYELGITASLPSFSYDAAIFQIDRKDYLGQKAGTYVRSAEDDEDLYTYNMGDIQSRGFELALNSDKSKMFSFDLAYTYLNAKFKEYNLEHKTADATYGPGATPAQYETLSLAGNYVPRTSKHTLNLIMDFKATDKLTISPELVAKSGYYADELNKFKQDGYEVVNLRSEYKYSKSLEFFAKIDNLLDKEYYQFINVSSSAFDNSMDDATIRMAAPRAYYAGLRYKF